MEEKENGERIHSRREDKAVGGILKGIYGGHNGKIPIISPSWELAPGRPKNAQSEEGWRRTLAYFLIDLQG